MSQTGSNRGERVLLAVADVAAVLVHADSWREVVPQVLRSLGEAAEVSRAYLFENSVDPEGRLVMSERAEWTAPGISPTIDLDHSQGFAYEPTHGRWADELGAGRMISGLAADFPDEERKILEAESVQSCALVPVSVAGDWWGFIGFDECEEPREWTSIGISGLRAAAETLGAAIARDRVDQRLEKAESRLKLLLENIPVVVYREHIEGEEGTFYISPQVKALLGYEASQFHNTGFWSSVIHPDDKDRIVADDVETNTSGEPFIQEYRMIAADGRTVWIRDEAVLIVDPVDGGSYWQGVWQDATKRKLAEAALAEAEEDKRLHIEALPAITYIETTDSDAEIGYTDQYVSPQIEAILGYSQEQWLSDTDASWWESIMHPDDRERVSEIDRQVSFSGEPYRVEYRLRKATGEYIWIRDEAVLMPARKGEPPFWHGVMMDISEQKQLEEQFREAEEKYRALIEQLPVITYLDPADESENSLYVSPQVETILGCPPAVWLSVPNWWSEHVHPDDREGVWDVYNESRETGERLVQEYRMVRDDGRVVWIREEATQLLNADGEPWLVQGLMMDITDRKEAEEQIAFLAYHDKLTELANRALLEELLEPALARAKRSGQSVAMLFMDLDNFKEVNDTLGHQAGDELLREIASRLVEATRETDVVARQGGDEFLVMLTDLELGTPEEALEGKDMAIQVAEMMAGRIHKAMRAPFPLGDSEIYTSMSIGISVYPQDAGDSRTLLKNADAAMYESKKARAGGYRLHSAREASDPLTQLSFTRRLQNAVKHQDWVLHYQPVVDLRDGSMIGVEALLRWRRPRGGLILPGEFLPMAEEMGLMEIIGEWVLEELAQQAAAWSKEGIDLNVSFNLSPRQLWQRDLADKIMKNLSEAGVDPDRAIVEISESTAMTDPARSQKVLWTLHERGLRVAVDDFGTGYSPPARLKHLPVDVLKIDQPLVRDLPDDAEVGNFLEAVMEFARDLDITPLAVGVENEAQRQFLVEKGCWLGQGYLFSKPVSPAEVAALYASGLEPDSSAGSASSGG